MPKPNKPEHYNPYGQALYELMKEKGFSISTLGRSIYALGYPAKNERSAGEAIRRAMADAAYIHHALTPMVAAAMVLSKEQVNRLYQASYEVGEQQIRPHLGEHPPAYDSEKDEEIEEPSAEVVDIAERRSTLLDNRPLLDSMVGKRVLVEHVAVTPPMPEEGEDEDAVDHEWPDYTSHLDDTIGRMGALTLEGYNQFGLEVRDGEEGPPFFIPWHAVLRVQPLSWEED